MNEETFYKIKLDLVHNTINNFVHVMQYDDGVAYIRAEIYKDWQHVYPSEEFDSAELRLKKHDGAWIKCNSVEPYIPVAKPPYVEAKAAGVYYYYSEGSYILVTSSMTEQEYNEIDPNLFYKNVGAIISLEHDYVKINVVEELTDIPGGCPAVIDLYSTDGHIQTAKFVLDVDRNPIQTGEAVKNVPEDISAKLSEMAKGIANAVKVTPQTLTDEEKAQARENIGVGASDLNIENGSAYDSLKQIDLPYTELVDAIVSGSSYSRAEVIVALASYGITSDTHNYIYGAGSTTFGIENTTGVQGDNSKGIASFNSGIGNKITGNGCSGNIGGTKNENGGSLSVIAGGTENTIGNENGRNGIIGGEHNELDANDAFIGGGIYNEIWEKASGIIGGRYNKIGESEDENVKARYAVIAGGNTNRIINDLSQDDADFAFIGGGQGNIVQHRNATTLGGYGLKTGRGNQALVGQFNEVVSDALFAVGNGTSDNNRSNALVVSVDGSAKIGGVNNSIDTDTAKRSVIAGGYTNKIQNTNALASDLNGFIGGGQGNIIANYKNVGMLGGLGLRARWGNQALTGAYNELSKALFIVGNGTSDTNRSNAFEVYSDGHAEVQTQGTTDNSVAQVKFVNDAIASAGGGTKFYRHRLHSREMSQTEDRIIFLSTKSTPFTYTTIDDDVQTICGSIMWFRSSNQYETVWLYNYAGVDKLVQIKGPTYNPSGLLLSTPASNPNVYEDVVEEV